MKQYIGFVRDHSISMTHLAAGAARDYNTNVKAVQDAANAHQLDTIVSTVLCGIKGEGWNDRGVVKREIVNSNVHMLKPIPEQTYLTNGSSTPLLDSVGELIEIMESMPDAQDQNVSFLLIVITDGQENDSHKWDRYSLTEKIKKLQYSDRWTFTFRVPRGETWYLEQLGIPRGNILEWDQTQHGLERATKDTVRAVTHYYTQRSKGVTSSRSFYADLSDVSIHEVKRNLKDISKEIEVWPVKNAGSEIRTFCEFHTNDGDYLKGAAFYELTKPETVQDYKQIVIRNRKNGKCYGGPAARQMLGLPDFGQVRLRPGDHGQYDIFIQSTSVNRKLMKGTRVVYWEGAVR